MRTCPLPTFIPTSNVPWRVISDGFNRVTLVQKSNICKRNVYCVPGKLLWEQISKIHADVGAGLCMANISTGQPSSESRMPESWFRSNRVKLPWIRHVDKLGWRCACVNVQAQSTPPTFSTGALCWPSWSFCRGERCFERLPSMPLDLYKTAFSISLFTSYLRPILSKCVCGKRVL